MKYLLVVVGIVFAVWIRLWDLSSLPNGLHWDEQDTGYQVYSLLKTGKDYFGNKVPLFLHSMADYRTPVFIYSAVPAVAVLGLTPLSVRLPSFIWGSLALILFYVLCRMLFPRSRIAWLAIFLFALSPWQWIYSRTSVECNAMLPLLLLGLTAFLRGLSRPSWFSVSAVGFGLAIASYSPAKFFVPLFVLTLLIIHFRSILSHSFRWYLAPVLILLFIAGPIIWDGFFGVSGTRFRDVSILNNPMLAQDVNYDRHLSAISTRKVAAVGVSPTILDKVSFNKFQRIWWEFSGNYLRIFSPEYLFIKGDIEPRHSPGKDVIGQLHLIEVVPLFLGLSLLGAGLISRRVSLVLISWLLLGGIPSSLTRGGGPHAARTYLLLPAFLLLVYSGLDYLHRKIPLVFSLYLAGFTLSAVFVFHYVFTTYRTESARPFQWGFDQAVTYAVEHQNQYDRVILDMKEDYALMSYLFTTRMDPASFQATYPMPSTEVAPETRGVSFGKITLLYTGYRRWTDIYTQPWFPRNQLIIADATLPLIDKQIKLKDTILYPDGSPAFFIFSN